MFLGRRACVFAAALVLYLPTSSPSQDSHTATPPGATSRDRSAPVDSAYHLTAGRSSLREIDGERVLELLDGVRITHGDVVVRSDRGRQYTTRRVTRLTGHVTIDQNDLHMEGETGEYFRFQDRALLRTHVKILDRGWTIHCDEAEFFRNTDQAWLRGDVVVVDSSTTMKADTVFYDKGRMFAEAFGNVSIYNAKESVLVRGKHGWYVRDKSEAIIDRSPHLVVDPYSEEPATVDSDTMRFYPDTDRAIAYGRVKILKGNTVTQCDSAVVIDADKRAELYGNPLAKQDNASMQANKMILRYNEEEVDQINLVGAAKMQQTPKDTLIVGRDSWVEGDSMRLYLHDNRLDSIQVVGNSTSEYYPESRDKVEANFVRGETMFFVFTKDSLSFVRIVGKADGVYRFLDLKKKETADSLRAVVDTALVFVPFDKQAKKVTYAADSIEYFAKKRDLDLRGKAKVDYEHRTLLGKQITYHAGLQMLDASGEPVLIEDPDKFYGRQMDYDLESGIGLVQDGSTKFMEGYYHGREIAKVGEDELKVWHSTYTTCNLKVPHYHFAANQMKVYLNDKVVSGPIVLFIGDTPIAALPFFAQNIRRGRRSGILRPEFEFGVTSRAGRFIRNVGYYWATNDYTDFTFVGDFNEDQSLRLLIDNRYRVRYRFNGGVNFSLFRDLRTFRDEWTLSSTHNQTLGEKFNLTSSLRFVSSDRAPRAVSTIDQVADVIDRRIESTVNLNKSWETVSFGVTGRRVQYLDITNPSDVKVSAELPTITLSIPSRSLYFGAKHPQGHETFWESVLGGVRYSPALSANRATRERLYDYTETITANQSLSFSSPQKLGFLNIQPNLAVRNAYTRTATKVDSHMNIDSSTNPPDTTAVAGSRTVTTDNVFSWNTGARASTNLYGTFYPKIGTLRGIRHTMSPAVSYSFTPEQGGRPSSQSIGVSVSNAVDLKVGEGEAERKLSGVLIWSLASSYNPQAPSRRGWSPISSGLNVRVLGTTVSVNQSIDAYTWEINSTSVTSSFSLKGTHPFGQARNIVAPELNVAAERDTTPQEAAAEKGAPQPGEEHPARGLPWSLSASFSYSNSKFGDPRSTLNLNGDISLTQGWRISYTTTYDVQGRDLLGQNFGIHRDLHCWEMSFSRQKLGDEWEFYFRINVVAHPEIYAEQGQRGLSGGGFANPFQY